MSKNNMLGSALAEVAGPLKDLLDKLGGKDGECWLKALKQFLRKESSWEHVIDCSAKPMIPDGWSIHEEDQLISCFTGELVWSTEKIQLHLDPGQKGEGFLEGHNLKKRLEGQPVLPSNVLDYLLEHPALTSSDWTGKLVYFWGTIYRDSDGDRHVRYLDWAGGSWSWHWDGRWLGREWGSSLPAAVLA